MNQKPGRNDPCPCGSGKKYKSCCLLNEKPKGPRKLTAKWINAPAGPNLLERAFGENIASKGETFKPIPKDGNSGSLESQENEQKPQ